jgi:acylphosphatase
MAAILHFRAKRKTLFSNYWNFDVLRGLGYKQRMASGGTNKRLNMVFSGRVQGVGFRYTVCRVAKPLAVTGFVRNLWDGDVEVVAEGPEQELVDLHNAIRASGLGRNIEDERVRWETATGEFKQFGITFR